MYINNVTGPLGSGVRPSILVFPRAPTASADPRKSGGDGTERKGNSALFLYVCLYFLSLSPPRSPPRLPPLYSHNKRKPSERERSRFLQAIKTLKRHQILQCRPKRVLSFINMIAFPAPNLRVLRLYNARGDEVLEMPPAQTLFRRSPTLRVPPSPPVSAVAEPQAPMSPPRDKPQAISDVALFQSHRASTSIMHEGVSMDIFG